MTDDPRRHETTTTQTQRRHRIGWRHASKVAVRTVQASTTDRVSLAAAGCAFYGMLALFPAISVLISVYGLVFEPHAIESQLHLLSDLLPPPAFGLIQDRVTALLAEPHATLSTSLIVSSLLTFWSSATGSKSMLSAVNVAYDIEQQRDFLRFQAMGLAMTLVALLGAVTTLAVLVGLRPALLVLGVDGDHAGMIHKMSLLLLLAVFGVAVALLYRFGPSRVWRRHHVVLPGTLLATALWLAVSEGLSVYVLHLTDLGATYGSLGAVIGVMLWLYVSTYAVLLGAELNAQLEAFETGK
ncbi:MAG: YihY/virulence factor BrkB family protein [Acetobacteraceae bacterium]